MENTTQFAGVIAVGMTCGVDARTVGAAVNGGDQTDRIELNIAVPLCFDTPAQCLVAEVDGEIGIGDTITANRRIAVIFDDASARHIRPLAKILIPSH